MNDVQYEDAIAWLADRRAYPFIRETWAVQETRRRPFSQHTAGSGVLIVGYAVLQRNAPAASFGFFDRRFFWVKDRDRDGGQCPSEAIIPASAVPRCQSQAYHGLWSTAPALDESGFTRDISALNLPLSPERAAGARREPLTAGVRSEVWTRDGAKCRACGISDSESMQKDGKHLHFDHVTPVSRGGASVASNVQLLCAGCNLAKAAKMPGV
jgi:Family of unknown function (DUF6009)/HNH endonuclease